jgi:hypothetical protein
MPTGVVRTPPPGTTSVFVILTNRFWAKILAYPPSHPMVMYLYKEPLLNHFLLYFIPPSFLGGGRHILELRRWDNILSGMAQNAKNYIFAQNAQNYRFAQNAQNFSGKSYFQKILAQSHPTPLALQNMTNPAAIDATGTEGFKWQSPKLDKTKNLESPVYFSTSAVTRPPAPSSRRPPRAGPCT